MYMGRVGSSAEGEVSNELAQSRILVTGLTALAGVDVARSFADLKAKLVVHTTDLSPELIELVALLSQSARHLNGRRRRRVRTDIGSGLWRSRSCDQSRINLAR